jgi:hypothetical protein
LGEWDGPNLYTYVYNNPISWIDFFGLAGYPIGFIGPIQPGDYYYGKCLITAYCDKGPGADWPYFKPKKAGDKPGSVGPGTVACANSKPNKPWPFGTKVKVYDKDGKLVYDGEVHDTGAGWDSRHHNVPPGQWFDIWLPTPGDARRWGKQDRDVRIYPR